jgi:predicted RNA methylase
MSVSEAEAILRAVKHWHYPIDLPWGRTVPSRPGVDPGRHLGRKAHFVDRLVARYFGSLQGKMVLDLGCCQGFWSFHASRAGAVRCVGIDSSEIFVREARAVATLLGIENCDFQCHQLEDDPWWGEQMRSEITFMLGLFYHLLDPISVLRKAASLTLETLVVDTQIQPGAGPVLHLVPRDSSEPTTRLSNVISNLRMVPTKEAVVNLISDFGFEDIECLAPDSQTPPEYHSGHRISIIAAKRRNGYSRPQRL